ncbi:MAG: cation:proton antiporter [Halobacteria archaeon]
MIDPYLIALLAAALAASFVSFRLGVSVAIAEIVMGMLLGSVPGLSPAGHDWLPFLAGLGSLFLTFLAGAEIDPDAFRARWKASTLIGVASFGAPFLGAWWFSEGFLGWTRAASLLAGVALSTTSVAVVYVVLVETGLTSTPAGKLILSSCFVTDLGTAVALSVLFIPPNGLILLTFAGLGVSVVAVPRLLDWFLSRFREGVGQMELKMLLLMVLLLGLSAEVGGSHGVLPAYVVGLIAARTFQGHRGVLLRLRGLTFALLTPFFFLHAGLNVSLAAVAANLGLLGLLFGVKVGAKFAGVLPLARRYLPKDAIYATLLMSTGLTFGTISSTYGLQAGIVSREQFSVLVTAVLLTAIVPTLVAQRWYTPDREGSPERAGAP